MSVGGKMSVRLFSVAAFAFFAVALGARCGHAAGEDGKETDALKYLPVQEAGRVKPFDSFARESMQLIYGKQTFTSAGGLKRPAREVVMTWMLAPQFWNEQQIVQINHQGLKEALLLDKERTYFSPAELFRNERFPLVIQELGAKREAKEKLGPYYQSAQRLESALGLYEAIKNGTGVHAVPPATGDKWIAVSELKGEGRDRFMTMARALIHSLPRRDDGGKDGVVPPADPGAAEISLAQAVEELSAYGHRVNAAAYGSQRDIELEVLYNDLHPFMLAWSLYLLTALIAAFAWHLGSRWGYRAAWVAAVCAFSVHTFGFGLRIFLTGRPPVSNMYESVIWVSWGAVLFSLVFEAIRRKRYPMVAGSVVAVICLIVADMAPAILDQSLQPLEPVLRSNYWLTIHVLTITLSYSAFFLAWGLANIGLGFVLRGDKPAGERVRDIVQSVYRAIQVGTVLLAAGTILGGIWADYSWGRFWGWDPKETWAFIALLGYVAILHGRLGGWIHGFGILASAVISFSLVIMAWYGVNYVLGAGLHTYGFGAGGVQYVGGFVILNLIYVGYVAFIRAQREKVKAS